MTPPLDVVYQDNFLIVINKPPQLVVTPADSVSEITLSEILQKDFLIDIDRGGVVHRLDKDTSGLIIAAKDIETFDKLQQQFKERSIQKTYLCLVHGILEKGGVINAPIDRNPRNRERFVVIEGGKEAQTVYQPLKYFSLKDDIKDQIFPDLNKVQKRKLDRSGYGLFTLVECQPKTGRTHQIRVHLKHLGHSLVGDERYGGRKLSRYDRRWCQRQFLHAQKITFTHPDSGKELSFTADLPNDLQVALKNLAEYHISKN
jgi:23S rRNA pseudouridine1911/1915/1917 synthase